MTCDEIRPILDALHDGELSPLEASRVEEHLASCEQCKIRLENLRALSSAFRAVQPEPPSDVLRARIERQIGSPKAAGRRWLAPVAAVLLVAAFLAGRSTTPNASVRNELVASHIRSLLGNHLIDVVSTDRHTVKPWFAGKVDLTADPYDFKSNGFPLEGGRLDYVGGKPVPVFVYGHGKHVVNLYVLPSDMAIPSGSIRGYSVDAWRQGDIELAAVSDAGMSELDLLKALYEAQRR